MLTWNAISRTGGIALLVGMLITLVPATASLGATVLAANGAQVGGQVLSAGDEVAAGQSITVGAGGSAALSVGDLWVECGPGAQLRIEADGSLSVDAGVVRVVDLAEGGAETRLHTPHAELRLAGGDTEVLVDSEGTRVCERRHRVEVAPREQPEEWTRTEAGQCAAAAGGVVTTTAGGGELLALSGAHVDIAIANLHSPQDVAGDLPGGPSARFPLDPDKRSYLACDGAGSCAGAPHVVQIQPARIRAASPSPTPIPEPGFGFGTGPADGPDQGREE